MDVSAWFRLRSRVEALEKKIAHMGATSEEALKLCRQAHEKVTDLAAVKPIKGQPQGATLEVDLETKRQMNITAQALGLRSGEELFDLFLEEFLVV